MHSTEKVVAGARRDAEIQLLIFYFIQQVTFKKILHMTVIILFRLNLIIPMTLVVTTAAALDPKL